MKVNEVPQEDANAFEKEFSVLQYATDENGKFKAVKSVGWKPKTEVMQNAWNYQNEKVEKAIQLVRQGKRSPLYYHARKHMMNAKLLSAYTGFSVISVLLHFRPGPFRRLKKEKLEKYYHVFGYSSIKQLIETETK